MTPAVVVVSARAPRVPSGAPHRRSRDRAHAPVDFALLVESPLLVLVDAPVDGGLHRRTGERARDAERGHADGSRHAPLRSERKTRASPRAGRVAWALSLCRLFATRRDRCLRREEPRFNRPRIRVFSQRFRGDFDASVLSPSAPALLRARRRVPLRACPALRGSPRAADRGPPLRPRPSPSRQARRPRETPKGNKASAMGDEDPVMPVGDNVTFENTYMQKPEEFGEVRPDTRHARGSRRRFETDKPDAARTRRTMPSTRCPIFGTNRDLCGALTRRSSSSSSEPKRRKRDRGTSSCAVPFRKS